MKTLLFTIALGLLSSVAMAQPEMKPVGGTGPMISVDNEVLEYGTIERGSDGLRTIIVTNTGDQPLLITQCTGSCGCTVPECQKEPIKPGATSKVAVKYDTNRIGQFNKTVTINSNAVNEPTLMVKVSGNVEGKEEPGHEGHGH